MINYGYTKYEKYPSEVFTYTQQLKRDQWYFLSAKRISDLHFPSNCIPNEHIRPQAEF